MSCGLAANIALTRTAPPLTTSAFAKPWKNAGVTKWLRGQHGLVALLFLFATVVPLPYAVLSPGPATNVLNKNLISIKGAPTFPTDGKLFLTTVSVSNPDSILRGSYVLQEWVSPNDMVMPRDSVYPPTDNVKEIEQRNAEEMRLSQQHATTAALKFLGYRMPSRILVLRVVADSPAENVLKAADEILEVDGTKITSVSQVVSRIRAHKPGEKVNFVVKRGNETLSLQTSTIEFKGNTFVGFAPTAVYDYPFEVNIKLNDVGGPSAGMMFALGIIDKLDRESLTRGRNIAGTGTIDDDGNIGAIGGIAEKIIGAADRGAKIFLAPVENCVDITKRPEGIKIVAVSTLSDAVKALRAKDGAKLPTCP